MAKILLLGAGGPAGINVLKSFNLLTYKPEMYGNDSNEFHIKFAEKYTKKNFTIPRDKDYLKNLNQVIDENQIDFIHAQSDSEVKWLSDNRHDIHAKTFLPSERTIEICQDKQISADIWDKKGFPSIESLEINDKNMYADLASAAMKFGKVYWLRATHGAGGKGSTKINDAIQGVHWINYWRNAGENCTFIAQRFLSGRNIAWSSIWKNGELLVSQGRERLEYIYPYLAPSGVTGTPVVAKTLNEDAINFAAKRAVLAIDEKATGIFSVDMKEDEYGNIFPTEINAGRFFTTSYFYSYASYKLDIPEAHFPFIYLQEGLGEKYFPIKKHENILPSDLYWIRHIDCGEILWDSKTSRSM